MIADSTKPERFTYFLTELGKEFLAKENSLVYMVDELTDLRNKLYSAVDDVEDFANGSKKKSFMTVTSDGLPTLLSKLTEGHKVIKDFVHLMKSVLWERTMLHLGHNLLCPIINSEEWFKNDCEYRRPLVLDTKDFRYSKQNIYACEGVLKAANEVGLNSDHAESLRNLRAKCNAEWFLEKEQRNKDVVKTCLEIFDEFLLFVHSQVLRKFRQVKFLLIHRLG